MILSMLKVSSDKTEKVGCARLALYNCIKKSASPRYADFGFNNRVGSEAMSCAILKPKQVSRQSGMS